MKEVKELIDKSGQIYLRVNDDENCYKAYTPAAWVELADILGHGIKNIEHARACCRGDEDKRSSQVDKLPSPWFGAKHKDSGRVYIYRRQPAEVDERDGLQKQLIPWESVKLEPSMEGCLRSYKYDAIVSAKPVKAEITFFPNGLANCRPIGHVSKNVSSTWIALAFNLSWDMKLASLYKPGINFQKEINNRFSENLNHPTGQKALLDFKARCLWCGKYKSSSKRKNSRYCKDSHRSALDGWARKLIKTHRKLQQKNKFVPDTSVRSPWLPELFDHPTIKIALHDRYQDIVANLT